jgi:hypothetical protein
MNNLSIKRPFLSKLMKIYLLVSLALYEELHKLVSKNITVFTDQNMGSGLTGLELTKKIKKSKKVSKVYILTNEILSEFESEARIAMADGCFNPPLTEAQIRRLLI